MTGIDLSERTIGAAQAHLSADPQLQEHVKYRACSADSLVNDGEHTATVLVAACMHSRQPDAAICHCARPIKRGCRLTLVGLIWGSSVWSSLQWQCQHLISILRVGWPHAAGAKFDAVIASEVIEHVIDPGSFLRTLSQLTRHDGALVISTLARTARSYAFAIVGAEYVAGLVPRGTHDWNKFLTPGKHEPSSLHFACPSSIEQG